MGWSLPGLGHPHGLLCSIGASEPARPSSCVSVAWACQAWLVSPYHGARGRDPSFLSPASSQVWPLHLLTSICPSPPLHPSCPCPCPATHLSLLDQPLCLQASPLIHLLSVERVSRNRSDPIAFHDSLLPSGESADEPLFFFFLGTELPPLQGIHLTTHETPSPGFCSAREGHTPQLYPPPCTFPHGLSCSPQP